MFNRARLKLTAWYLVIIMVVSASFSMVMYEILTSELDRVERVQRSRVEYRFNSDDGLPHFQFLDPVLVAETKDRLKIFLFVINLIILGTSAGAGYFLAGRTLRPIKEMVDEQNLFITDASHELRTPLTSLRSEIEVNLRDKNLTLLQSKKLLESNLEEVNNLQVLSDSLIKLTQYRKEDNGLAVSEISLSSIVGEAIKKVVKLAKNKNITIINKVKDCTFEGEKLSLIELLVIFLDNAIKYSSKKSQINLTSQPADGYVSLKISDQGIGINEVDLPHLFDRFYRADKSRTKSDTPGYGLGLSIAKQIIEKHHGSISVKSKFSEGTTFTIQIPLKHTAGLIGFSKLFIS